jgi:hypothetical protein
LEAGAAFMAAASPQRAVNAALALAYCRGSAPPETHGILPRDFMEI